MAIPGFFSFMKEKYNNIVQPVNRPLKCDALYIDMGSILHGCLSKARNEDLVSTMVLEFIQIIITKCSPRQLVFLAFDGVPPVAKLKEQAGRRRLNSHSAFGLNPNILSPGTEFMQKLTDKLSDSLEIVSQRRNVKILISPVDIKGEGEHKIFQHISQNSHMKSVVYSLDADIILLSLLSPAVSRIRILREMPKTRYESIAKKKFECLEVNTFRNHLLCGYSIKKQEFLIDIVLLLIILGNDFLPRPEDLDINFVFDELLECLRVFHQNHEGASLVDSSGAIALHSLNLFIADVDNLSFEEYKNVYMGHDLISQLNRLKLEQNDDPFRREYDKWKYDRYQKWQNKDKADIEQMAGKYLQGLQWVLKYYLTGTYSEHWVFEHDYVPRMSELRLKEGVSIEKIKTKSIEFKPLHHLSFVLPPSSSALLPKSYRDANLKRIDQLVSAAQFEEEINRISEEVDPLLSRVEADRNRIRTDLVIIGSYR